MRSVGGGGEEEEKPGSDELMELSRVPRDPVGLTSEERMSRGRRGSLEGL